MIRRYLAAVLLLAGIALAVGSARPTLAQEEPDIPAILPAEPEHEGLDLVDPEATHPASAYQPAAPGGAPPPGSGSVDFNGYVRVIDGNTVEVRINGNRAGIGLIGVDVPEGNTPCGREAAALLQSLVRGGLRLEEDQSVGFDDRKRRMYHAFAKDGREIALEALAAGVARASADGRGRDRARINTVESEASAAVRGCVHGGGRQAEDGAGRANEYVAPASAAAAAAAPLALPGGFTQDTVVSGLTASTAFTWMPDGRMLIAQQNGVVRLYKNGALQPAAFIDLQDRVNDYWDHGLLGMAVDPQFDPTTTPPTNPYLYLLYTYEDNPAQYSSTKTARLARYTISGDTASKASEVVLLGSQVGSNCQIFPVGADCIPSESPSHSVGNIKFADDGSMFVTTGDAASFNTVDDLALRSQNVNTLAGKVLRITTSGQGLPGNPFWSGNASDNRSKVWAYGLRNPYRFNLRPENGLPYVGDVGWNQTEEVSVAARGANLGWPCYEGATRQSGYESKPVCGSLYLQGAAAVRQPLVYWGHCVPTCSSSAATGGVFYTGSAYPAAYQNAYFYADFGKGWIRHMKVDSSDIMVPGTDTLFEGAANGPVDIELGPDGNLYYLSVSGSLFRVRYTGAGNRPPTVVAAANAESGLAPLSVQFSSVGSADPDADPLTYSWNFGDGSPTSTAANPQHTYTANGNYTATLTVSDGKGGTGTDSVAITVGNRAPTATIGTPLASLTYKVGDVISYSGSATDPEDGSVAATGLAWQIIVHHCPFGNCHRHNLTTGSGTGGSFTIPDHGDESHFEIQLTATDAGGLTDTASVTIMPRTVQLTLATAPSGLQLVYDGAAGTTPLTRTTVAGSTHTLEAPSPQSSATFVSWSDGGAAQHNITVGTANATYTATFTMPPSVTFDDKAGENQPLNGQYPTGLINWGTGVWYHSPPWGLFTTKSVSFTGGAQTSGSFTWVTPRRMLSIDAYNDATNSTVVSLQCAGQPEKSVTVPAKQVLTISTGWTAPCATVTIEADNGWNTNFDNLVYDGGSGGGGDTTAPVISAVQAVGVTASRATISWTTNEASDTQVEYGTTTSYGQSTTLNTSMVTSHSQALSGLTANTLYHYRVKSKDAAGNLATSADFTFTTANTGDPTPPVISAVQATAVTSSGATITWTTDDPADTQVEYGTTTAYGSSTTLAPALVTSHSQALSGLTANTLYHYRVKSKNAAGDLTTSADFTFTTTAAPSGATVTFDDKAGQDQALNGQYPTNVINWGTGLWYHSAPWGPITTKSASFEGPGVTSRSFTFVTPRRLVRIDAGNSGGAASTVTLSCAGQTTKTQSVPAGQVATIDTAWSGTCTTVTVGSSNGWDTNFDNLVYDGGGAPDTTAPTISAVAAGSVTSSGATVTWTTNEASDTQVEYGTTTSYGQSTTLNTSMVTSHSQALAGLTANTLYHYRVKSKDAAGNLATSADFTFTTGAPAPPDTTPPTISAVQATAVTHNSATITWTTNEPADRQVEYGTTTAYGSATTLNTAMATSHSVPLSGLTANTLYHYRVKSKDAAGNLATSANFTFTTTAAPATQTVTFDNKAGQEQPLNGQYPTGVINWGTGVWYHSGPFGQFTTKSISFDGAAQTSGTFTFITARRLVSIEAFNGGGGATTVTLACSGQTTKTQSVAANQKVTISTGWTGTCTTVTVTSSNGWNTNFDTLIHDAGPLTAGAVEVTPAGDTAAYITWATDAASTGEVEIGATPEFGDATAAAEEAATDHAAFIDGLKPDVRYYFRIKSRDGEGNVVVSDEYSFTVRSGAVEFQRPE